MYCSNCGKENRAGSDFCRHCGVSLERSPLSLFKKVSRRIWIIVAIAVVLSGGTAYAAPKINDYVAVSAALGNAKHLQNDGNYTDALAVINAIAGRWMFQSTRQELESLREKETSYIQDQNNLQLAITKEDSGDLGGARDILRSISTEFPQYKDVQARLASVQAKVESQLQNQAQQAQDQAQAAQAEKAKSDAKAAQATAAAAQASREKLDAQATAAAAAQAQAQANAEAGLDHTHQRVSPSS